MNTNNILSYIKWRGDISLSARPFDEVDALVIATFSYIHLDGIVPDSNKEISIKEVAKKYFNSSNQNLDHYKYQDLLKLMANSVRFGDAKLSYFADVLTDRIQFSAIKISLDNDTNFISFRGTDDTLVGWKEDFEISFRTTGAQKYALKYLTNILKNTNQVYSLAGHSKGGNLAEYAAVNLPDDLKDNIDTIYTFDSPGLSTQVDGVTDKLKRYVPEFSIIGRLFEPENITPTILVSDRPKLAQHDPMSWEVSGSHFITRAHRNPTSKIYNQIINQWIGEANLQEREALTNDLFSAFAASGATKITELNKNGFGGFGAILFSLTDSSRRTRFVLGSLWETIWRSIKATHLEKLFINTNSIIGWVLILLGIVDLTIPDYAYRAFGGLVALFCVGWSGYHIVEAANSHLLPKPKRFFIITYLIVFGLAIAIISNNRLLNFLAHYVLGIFLIGFAYVRLRSVIVKNKKNGIFRNIIDVLESLIAFAAGIIVIINPNYFSRQAVISLGILLIIYGFFQLIIELFKQRKLRMPSKHR